MTCILSLQDLGLAINAAEATKSAVLLGSHAEEIYSQMTKKGYGGKDFSSAFQVIQTLSEGEVENKINEFLD